MKTATLLLPLGIALYMPFNVSSFTVSNKLQYDHRLSFRGNILPQSNVEHVLTESIQTNFQFSRMKLNMIDGEEMISEISDEAEQVKEVMLAVETRAAEVEKRIALLKEETLKAMTDSSNKKDEDLKRLTESMQSSEMALERLQLDYDKEVDKNKELIQTVNLLKDEIKNLKLEKSNESSQDDITILQADKERLETKINKLNEKARLEKEELEEKMKKEISLRDDKLASNHVEMTQKIIKTKGDVAKEYKQIQDKLEDTLAAKAKIIEEYQSERSSARKIAKQFLHLVKQRIRGNFKRKTQE